MVGTYPPTECGLATFTNNLTLAIAEGAGDVCVEVVRLVDSPEIELHDEVVAHWVVGDAASRRRSVEVANRADVVMIQHEYGLFAGPDGEEVLEFVSALTRPLVVVLHSVLAQPSPRQRRIVIDLMRAAEVLVVQSHDARRRLSEIYGFDPARVEVIAHGAVANVDGAGMASVPHPAILTWGLLGPGKGIEHGIAAVAHLAREGIRAHYVVAGATHPKVLAAAGESYRSSLRRRARRLHVLDRVHFDDAYRDWSSLRAMVRSADVVLLPYDSREQESSGVLVEALASAKPIVATPFPHAVELLSTGAGILVPHGDAAAMSAAIARVLREPGVATTMSERAREQARSLLWPAIGAQYRALIAGVRALAASN